MYAAPMQIVVNGEPRLVLNVDTVSALVLALGFVPERVAVEQNGALVLRADRATTAVNAHDVIEIVTLVGGG